MATEVTNYKCPSCTGPLHFAGESEKMECEYCGNIYDVDVIQQLYTDKEEAASAEPHIEWDSTTAGGTWSPEELAHIVVYNCPSCGAELVCDDTIGATACPYCGNPAIVPKQFSGQLKPDYVIPFKLNKENAVNTLKDYYRGKPLLPKKFSKENHIEEVKGVYVPFWLYDGKTDASIRYRGTLVHTYLTNDEEVTVTEYYRVVRGGNVIFEKVPVDASSKISDAHMDSIEPFDYSELKPFTAAYLSGFFANRYDQDAQVCSERAAQRIRTSTQNAFADTARKYHTLIPEYSDIQLANGDIKYALLPVWILHTKWNNENFLFTINGQTGEIIGNLPVSKLKLVAWFLGISAPLMYLIGTILFTLLKEL